MPKTVKLLLEDIPEEYATMIQEITHAFRSDAKCGIQINLSGSKGSFGWKYINIDSKELIKIISGKTL